jgi:hypothetical protein
MIKIGFIINRLCIVSSIARRSLAYGRADSGLQGTGIWNIMYYYAQMWLIINSQYEIESVLL